MITFEQALKKILAFAPHCGSERIQSSAAHERVLAQDLRSDTDMPPFDKSLRDGFAVRSADTNRPPAKLRLIEEVPAGRIPSKRVGRGECSYITTGSVVPKGADAVLMVEESVREGINITIRFRAKKGDYILAKGQEYKQGQVVVRKRRELGAPEIATLATIGRTHCCVARRPRVAILITGDEVIEPSQSLRDGYIRNANGPLLICLVAGLGVSAEYLGIARDTKTELRNKVRKGLCYDVLIICGGVSMGKFDLVPTVLAELGIRKVFHKVAIKPGKPLWFGKKGRKLVFGVPGNPVSCFISFLLFIKPALLKMMASPSYKPQFFKGILTSGICDEKERRFFYPCVATYKASGKVSGYYLKPVVYQGSSDIGAVTRANAFITLDRGKGVASRGSLVEFIFI